MWWVGNSLSCCTVKQCYKTHTQVKENYYINVSIKVMNEFLIAYTKITFTT